VQGWLNDPSSNNGIVLAHTTNYDGFVFATKEGTTAPKLTINYTTSGVGTDTTPPASAIVSGPSGTLSISSASFAFTSSEPNSTFECSLVSVTFSARSSPKKYTGLANGSRNTDAPRPAVLALAHPPGLLL